MKDTTLDIAHDGEVTITPFDAACGLPPRLRLEFTEDGSTYLDKPCLYREHALALGRALVSWAEEQQPVIDARLEKCKARLLFVASDYVNHLLYYDRKEDSECRPDDVEALIKGGHLTLDEVVDAIRKGMAGSFKKEG